MREGLAGMVRFEPRRFRSTVPYYARYRVPYPDRLIEFVARHCGLERGDRVLDLGCGPGPLAVAFARLGAAVTAMDPEPEMLAAAKERAQETGVTLTLLEGSSYDLGPALGRFRLVTMGRSFHWMDREETLSALDGLIEPGGAVVLFSDRRIEGAGANWRQLLGRLRREFAPARAAERHRRRTELEAHEAVLLRSVFPRLERHSVISRRMLSPDEIVGRVYSLSDTSPEALGDRQPAFEKKLRAGLARLSRKHELSEILEVNALIARRSQML